MDAALGIGGERQAYRVLLFDIFHCTIILLFAHSVQHNISYLSLKAMAKICFGGSKVNIGTFKRTHAFFYMKNIMVLF